MNLKCHELGDVVDYVDKRKLVKLVNNVPYSTGFQADPPKERSTVGGESLLMDEVNFPYHNVKLFWYQSPLL